MNPHHRTRVRTRAAAVLTTIAFGLLITTALHSAHLTRLLLALAATLGAITATLALAAAFAPTTATRQAATGTLDLLLRLVPWYTPRR
ncbi:hypothetical protein ABZX28_33160 [Streptomyces rubiginosohelvolus]|uniref:hypothetical protein n=1 Tax=Streptomyces rubiginosohelvolus TaxID=67362 RepID=UPI0033AD78DD